MNTEFSITRRVEFSETDLAELCTSQTFTDGWRFANMNF